jgi:hypothetical protein
VNAPAFTAGPYAPYGAVHTFPVWGPTLASAWARACDGIAVDLGDVTELGIAGEPLPELRWCPATRRVRLSGTMRVPDIDQVPGGHLVDATLIPVFDLPAGFAPPISRTGACPSDGGWVRWLATAASGQTPGKLEILSLGANFPPVRIGGILQFPWVILDGITWRVPRT